MSVNREIYRMNRSWDDREKYTLMSFNTICTLNVSAGKEERIGRKGGDFRVICLRMRGRKWRNVF